MKNLYFFVLLVVTMLLFSCKSNNSREQMEASNEQLTIAPSHDTNTTNVPPPNLADGDGVEKLEKSATPTEEKLTDNIQNVQVTDEEFVDVQTLDSTIVIDIKYATADNFTKSQIYDCPKCWLRPEVARAIVEAHAKLKRQGLGLKMFDCYRPSPYQQRLWDKVPNPNYVTPPAKGSMHSRGAAVDLTIVDDKGIALDMGTPYDYFGKEAHTDYLQHPKGILENRELLKNTMQSVGLQGIRTEWWHFSFKGKNYPLSDKLWYCK